MKHLVFNFSDRFWDKRKAAARFNRAFVEGIERLREEIGAIKADHAAKGLLMSGATIKRGLSAYEASISGALDICLAYISAQTQHHGWKRRRHIALLNAMLSVFSERYNAVFVEHCVKVARGGDAASAAAESKRRKLDRALHDKVQQFAEGIGASKPEGWVARHPALSAIALSAASVIVAYALGLIGIK